MAEVVGRAFGLIQSTTQSLVNRGSSVVNDYMPPERRSELWTKFQKFINEKPVLASFFLSHLAISGPVLALFIMFTITVALFSLISCLLIGLLGAVLFIIMTVGFALIFVLPMLFFTTILALFFWFWGSVAYLIIKYLNQRSDPSTHPSVKSVLGNDRWASAGERDGYGSEQKSLKLESARPKEREGFEMQKNGMDEEH